MGYKSLSEAINAKRTELEEAKTRVVVLTGQLEAWLEAESLVGKPAAQAEASPTTQSRKRASPIKRRTAKRKNSENLKRGPKGIWKSIMSELVKSKGTIKLVDAENVCKTLGYDIKSNAIRSQMANFVNSGSLERVGPGTFRFTDLGKQTFAAAKEQHTNVTDFPPPQEGNLAAE